MCAGRGVYTARNGNLNVAPIVTNTTSYRVLKAHVGAGDCITYVRLYRSRCLMRRATVVWDRCSPPPQGRGDPYRRNEQPVGVPDALPILQHRRGGEPPWCTVLQNQGRTRVLIRVGPLVGPSRVPRLALHRMLSRPHDLLVPLACGWCTQSMARLS